MSDSPARQRLILVTPPALDAVRFAPLLAEALAAGDVAAVLIGAAEGPGTAAQAEALVPVAQAHGAAAIVAGDTRIAGHTKADGVHIGSGRLDDLRLAADSLRPKRIVGAGGIDSRHAAMEVGELDVDYLFFGRPHGDTHDEAHARVLDLAEWWSEIMQIPAVVMAGRSLGSVAEAAATGADFVALHEAVWSHAEGPAAAVRIAVAALLRETEDAA